MYDIMVYKFERKDIKVNKYYFTSESVTEGHPDKLCDYIADSILDECLKQDKFSRTAIEVFAYNNTIEVVGQVTSNAQIEIEKIVREKVKEIVDYMVSEGMQNTNCGSWVFDIPELCDKFDLPLEWFYEHNDDICRELGERDELADYEQNCDWNNHPLNYNLVYYTNSCSF